MGIATGRLRVDVPGDQGVSTAVVEAVSDRTETPVLDLQLTARDARLVQIDLITATIGADLALTGTLDEALAAGEPVPTTKTKAFGCTIKLM